jgi:hypothetical protein
VTLTDEFWFEPMDLLHLFLVHRVRAFFFQQVHKGHGVRAQAFEGFAVVFQWSRRDTTREAHRFNGGLMIISGLSPVGTTEQMGVVQPSLRDSIGFVRNPALKRWAGIVMSLRDVAPRPFGVRW